MNTEPVIRPGARLRTLVGACLKEQRMALWLAALALLGVVMTDVLAPWPLKIIFDHILLGKPLPNSLSFLQPLLGMGTWAALLVATGAIAALALTAGALLYLQLYTTAKVGHRITWRLRGELFAHLQRLPPAYHRDSRSGELLIFITYVTSLYKPVRDLGRLSAKFSHGAYLALVERRHA
jgi:ATP-binding cassette, subfamily B, bacterial